MTWPSSYSAGTLGYMVDRIDDELKRSGTITSQIQQCITDAITIYQKHRFRFSEGYDYSFNTVIDQEFYGPAALLTVTGTANNGSGLVRLTLSALNSGNVNLNNNVTQVIVAGIVGTTEANGTWEFVIVDSTHIDLVGSSFANAYVSGGTVTTQAATATLGGLLGSGQLPFEIDYLLVQIGTARFELEKLQPKDIDLLTQSGTQYGQPYSWCYYNESIRLYPVPSAIYPMIMGAHEFIAAPAALSTAGNRWMTDGERLIRSRAKYELSLNYGIDYPDLANRMLTLGPDGTPVSGAALEAFNELKREAAKITGTGRVRPTQF